MKKILLIALFVAAATMCTKAQYFQHLYGGPYSVMESGLNTVGQSGHVMAGRGQVTCTDENGRMPITPPFYFNNYYQLYSAGQPVLGTYLEQVFELPANGGYGVIGWAEDPNTGPTYTGFFYYLKLTASGTPIAAYSYSATSNFNVVSVSSVTKSASGTEIYVAGTAWLPGTSSLYMPGFVVKIDIATGAILWSGLYPFTIASQNFSDIYIYDIIESPYASEVVAVGVAIRRGYTGTPPMSTSYHYSFLMRLNSATGGVATSSVISYGPATEPASDVVITSIKVANSTGGFGSTQGFILGGVAKNPTNGDHDYLLIKTDQIGVKQWGKLYDYGSIPGSQQSCLDVIEREKAPGLYEYFLAGTVLSGYYGGSDMLVIRTTDDGTAFTNGEFTYGSTDDEHCGSIDYYDDGNPANPLNGISVFGTKVSPSMSTSQLYLVKACFNGVSSEDCEQYISTPVEDDWGPSGNILDVSKFGSFSSGTLDYTYYNADDSELCHTANIPVGPPIGDNNRLQQTEPESNEQGIISPNPMAHGAPVATVELETGNAAGVQVGIYDMLGKQYYKGSFTLAKGSNKLPLDISNAHMAPGMYVVKISGEGVNKNIMLIVK